MRISILLASVLSVAACDTGAAPAASPEGSKPEGNSAAETSSTVAVTVSDRGYEPGTVEVPENVPTTLVFTRTSEQGCGEEVVFPDEGIHKSLPLNEPVEITVTPKADQTLDFTCGMGMLRGSVVAAAR